MTEKKWFNFASGLTLAGLLSLNCISAKNEWLLVSHTTPRPLTLEGFVDRYEGVNRALAYAAYPGAQAARVTYETIREYVNLQHST